MRRLSWERTRTLIYNSLLWSVSTRAFWCWTPQVQHCSMTHDGTKGLPKPRLPWEFPPNPATIHRCALELRGPFFAGLQDWIFSFMEVTPPAKSRRSQGFPRIRMIVLLQFFTQDTGSIFVNIPSTMFFCSGEYKCLATIYSVLENLAEA